MGWLSIGCFIMFFFLRWLSRQFKEEPVINKTSDQYLKEYPELLEDVPTQINIYYTEVHNHLHINPDEGN